jgi:diguanylate cyclase
VQGGLNWYELVAVLDDLAVLILAVTDSGQSEFARYLKQLNERLASFLGTLSEAHEASEFMESVSHLQSRAARAGQWYAAQLEAVGICGLKQSLRPHLNGLLSLSVSIRHTVTVEMAVGAAPTRPDPEGRRNGAGGAGLP